MKMKRKFKNILCALAILVSVGGFATVAHAVNSYLDVTVSNIPGQSSPDPYSTKTVKDDDEQRFYIKLETLTNTPSMSFTAFRSNGEQMSVNQAITFNREYNLGETLSAAYDTYHKKVPRAGEFFYVYATVPTYYGGAHATGTYCP